MKRIRIVTGMLIFLTFFTSCEDQKSEKDNDGIIVGKWKLTKLVNISDQDKYLNTVLDLSSGGEYSTTNEIGQEINVGTWKYLSDEETVQFSIGFFSDRVIDFRIMKNDSDSLLLEEHYTLDDKDAYLEYHFCVVE